MFTTGEFSRVARVSRRLLQFYDEQALFRPAWTDPRTGYRAYTAHQLPELNRILGLKELGFSLGEIRQALRRNLPAGEIRQLLETRRAHVEADLAEAMQRIRALEARLLETSHAPDILTASFPEVRLLYQVATFPRLPLAWPWIRRLEAALAGALPRGALDYLTLSLPGDGFESEDFELEAGFALNDGQVDCRPAMAAGFTLRTLPARPVVATVVQPGTPELRFRGCGALGRWIERNGWTLVGAPRERLIGLPLPEFVEDTIVETQFEVQRSATYRQSAAADDAMIKERV